MTRPSAAPTQPARPHRTAAHTTFDTRQVVCIAAINRCTLVPKRVADRLVTTGLLEAHAFVASHSLALLEYNPALTADESARLEHLGALPLPARRRLYRAVYRSAWARVDAALATVV